MRTHALAEAKDRLSELVAAAQGGEEIVITRHGKPVARLVPMGEEMGKIAQRRAAIEELALLRADMRARGTGVTREEIIAWKNEERP